MSAILKDIAQILLGVPFRSKIESEVGGQYAVIQARDLGAAGLVRLDSAARVRLLPSVPRGGFLEPGDVLLQPRGTRFAAAMIANAPPGAVAAAPLWVLRADRALVLPEFLVVVLSSTTVQAMLRQAAVGTYVPQVPRQALEDLRIELPDLQSQSKLVELARLERREDELNARLRQARERLFDLAVSEVAKKARGRGNAPGPKPAPDGASAPKEPLSTAREREER